MPSKYPLSCKIDDKGFNAWLKERRDRISNMRPAMITLGDLIVKSVRQNFEESGRPDKWEKLSDATTNGSLRAKDYKANGKLRVGAQRKIASRKILIGLGMRSGLMDSIHYDADSEGVSIGPDNRPYARIHQLGGMAGRGKKIKIPARPYLMMQDEDLETAKAVVTKHILSD